MRVRIIAFVLISMISTGAVADPDVPPQPYPGSGIDLQVFQSAMTYARDAETYGGMGLSQTDARTWAMQLARGPRAAERLDAHKAAYAKARRGEAYGGFAMDRAEALSFSDRITGPYVPAGSLARYASAFTYARNGETYGGLGLTRQEAHSFSFPFGERSDGTAALNRYKEAYTLARRGQAYGGLGLDRSNARTFAGDASGVTGQNCNLGFAQNETAVWVRELRAQVPPAYQTQVDHIYGSACMNGTLSPQLLVQQIAPLMRAPAGPAYPPPVIGGNVPTSSCVSGADVAGDHDYLAAVASTPVGGDDAERSL